MLQTKNLHVSTENKAILNGLDLTVNPGELHVIMGPNGAGKSTLASVLAGKENYEVTNGSILFEDQDLLAMKPEERAQAGLFLAFQHPVEIPGITTAQFLRTALNEQRKARGEEPVDAVQFLTLAQQKMDGLGIDASLHGRSMNVGFSGGEKKRNEMLQLALLQPKLAILDEIDSGLDLDAQKTIADMINTLRTKDNAFLVISHNPGLINKLDVDYVHLLKDGKIMQTGGKELIDQLEKEGYAGSN